MSIKIMSQVWESGPEKQGHLLVMLALADYANDAGKCWPSIRSIAEKARMTERGVQKILRTLEDQGWVETAVGNGRKGCSEYTLNPERGSPPNEVHPERGDTKTPNDDAKTPNESAKNPEPRSPEPLRTVKNRHLEPSYGSNDLFDRFWAVVPRKKKKQEAKKAFDKACRQADPEQIIKAMELFAITQRDTDPQFIPHPTSWLNQGRWEDEPDHQPENIHDQLSQQMEQAHGIPTARISDCEAHQRLPSPVQETGQSGHGTQSYRNQGYGRSDERQNRLFGSR